MNEVVELNGMKFEKTRLLFNFKSILDSNPCDECHLGLPWVDYGGQSLCGKIDCARFNRKEPYYVWAIVGGLKNLKWKI